MAPLGPGPGPLLGGGGDQIKTHPGRHARVVPKCHVCPGDEEAVLINQLRAFHRLRLKIHFYDTCEPAPQFAFFQMKLRPRARFSCYSRHFDTYSSQPLFFFLPLVAGPGLCCFGTNQLRMLLVFSEMLQEYHTGHIRMGCLNLTDAAFGGQSVGPGGGSAKTQHLHEVARTPPSISQPGTRTNGKQRRLRPPVSLPRRLSAPVPRRAPHLLVPG